MLAHIFHYLFLAYTIMIFGRILGSWVPQFAMHPLMRFVAYYTDPYLNLFRRVVPPIGGMLDISPMLALFALNLIESIVMSLFF